MTKLNSSIYDQPEIIGKYLYCKQTNSEANLYNIFIVDSIEKEGMNPNFFNR